MKRHSFAASLGLLLALNCAHGAEIKLTLQKTANHFALKLLKDKKAPTEAEIKDYAKSNRFEKNEDLVKVFTLSVQIGAELAKTLETDSEVFKFALEENTLKEISATEAAPVVDDDKKKKDPEKAKEPSLNKFLAIGLNELKASSQTAVYTRAYELGFIVEEKKNQGNSGNGEAASSWDTYISALQNTADIDLTIASLNQVPEEEPKIKASLEKVQLDFDKAAKLSTPEQAPDRQFLGFLIEVGRKRWAELQTEKAALAKKAEEAKAVAAAAEKKAEKPTETPAATTKTEEEASVISPKGKIADTVLRNVGLSFGGGYGIVTSKSDSEPIQVAMLRWNWIQRSTTIRWNREVILGKKEGKLVGYGFTGMRGAPLLVDALGAHATYQQVANKMESSKWSPTSVGPFIGTALGGEKIYLGYNDTSGRVLERPYLAGFTLGWLYYDEASSLVNLDIGATISPHRGFRHAKPYFGISADGIVLLKLLEASRKFVPGGSK